MPKIRSVKGQTTVRGLTKAVRSQGGHTRAGGKHPKFVHPSGGTVPFPSHGNELRRGTAKGITSLLLALGFIVLIFACLMGSPDVEVVEVDACQRQVVRPTAAPLTEQECEALCELTWPAETKLADHMACVWQCTGRSWDK